MKKALSAIVLLLAVCTMAFAQKKGEAINYSYTDATTLNVFNKLLKTAQPWERLDVEKYPGITEKETKQALSSTGLAVCFETNSPVIGVRSIFLSPSRSDGNTASICVRGYDLYIQKDGKWLWAGCTTSGLKKEVEDERIILKHCGNEIKKCILYLPMYSRLQSLELVTKEGSVIRPADPGFKCRIAVFGSSFTNGSGATRPGMAYPAQLTRMTGYNFINMGFSGNSKLQPYFAKALVEADNIDAYVFDGFSNPSAKLIDERLFPFIEAFQAAKPGVPLIFMKTIYREKRNFDLKADKVEADKMEMAEARMQEAIKKYPNVYYLDCTNAVDPTHEWTTDGTHPDNYGYYLWAQSVAVPILDILRKYGK